MKILKNILHMLWNPRSYSVIFALSHIVILALWILFACEVLSGNLPHGNPSEYSTLVEQLKDGYWIGSASDRNWYMNNLVSDCQELLWPVCNDYSFSPWTSHSVKCAPIGEFINHDFTVPLDMYFGPYGGEDQMFYKENGTFTLDATPVSVTCLGCPTIDLSGDFLIYTISQYLANTWPISTIHVIIVAFYLYRTIQWRHGLKIDFSEKIQYWLGMGAVILLSFVGAIPGFNTGIWIQFFDIAVHTAFAVSFFFFMGLYMLSSSIFTFVYFIKKRLAGFGQKFALLVQFVLNGLLILNFIRQAILHADNPNQNAAQIAPLEWFNFLYMIIYLASIPFTNIQEAIKTEVLGSNTDYLKSILY